MIHRTLRAWRHAALAACAAFIALAPAPADAGSFTFTAIPDQDESRLNARFGKVAD